MVRQSCVGLTNPKTFSNFKIVLVYLLKVLLVEENLGPVLYYTIISCNS